MIENPGGAPEQLPAPEVIALTPENLEEHKHALVALILECFPQEEFDPRYAEAMVTKTMMGPLEVTLLLKDPSNSAIIGFTTAHIYPNKQDWAQVNITAITKPRQGEKLVGVLIGALEKVLKRRGVTTLTRSVRTVDGYADAIQRHYGDRIIETKEAPPSEADPRRFFKIRL